jgi:hypothetical protein
MYQLLIQYSLFCIQSWSSHGWTPLKLETEAARKAWKMKMSETPKWHMLLCHAVSLPRICGLVDKGARLTLRSITKHGIKDRPSENVSAAT